MSVRFQSPEFSQADEFYLALERYLAHHARERDFPACGGPVVYRELPEAAQLHREPVIAQMMEKRLLKARDDYGQPVPQLASS